MPILPRNSGGNRSESRPASGPTITMANGQGVMTVPTRTRWCFVVLSGVNCYGRPAGNVVDVRPGHLAPVHSSQEYPSTSKRTLTNSRHSESGVKTHGQGSEMHLIYRKALGRSMAHCSAAQLILIHHEKGREQPKALPESIGREPNSIIPGDAALASSHFSRCVRSAAEQQFGKNLFVILVERRCARLAQDEFRAVIQAESASS